MNWIKTSERAPEAGGEFLVHYLATHFTGIARFVAGPALPGQRWYADRSPGAGYAVPDYWAEIPPPPKEKSLGERVYEAVKLAGVPNRPERMLYRLAMNAASREAATEHAIEGSSPYLQGPRPLKMLDGIRIVIDDTLEDGVVELLRA